MDTLGLGKDRWRRFVETRKREKGKERERERRLFVGRMGRRRDDLREESVETFVRLTRRRSEDPFEGSRSS